jgi:uncharacterized protein YndB with AHSA1/START domain
MPDILQDFLIAAPIEQVYAAIATAEGLEQWWTKTSAGVPQVGRQYELGFGPDYEWRAIVTRADAPRRFELQMSVADRDWTGTRVAFDLSPSATGTQVRFSHRDWPEANEHYRISCHCWAMYLRLLRRHLEAGETVPYERRLDV